MYSLYLYFLGLSLRNTSKGLVMLLDRIGLKDLVLVIFTIKRKKVSALLINYTII